MKQFWDWLDHRTGLRGIIHEALYERIPGGARWRYVWGSTLVFVFIVQMITGFFLWTAYSPSTQTAWESVYYINQVMYLGSVVRGVHHFAAQAMVVLMALHLMQVVIDGAYKAPREINFWLGLILMQIVLGLSLTGYLLPWDQKGYYATKVSTNIAAATPIIGDEVQHLVQGGSEYGHHTLTRFFALHTGLLPALLIAFLALHIYVFRRHGITVPNPERAPTTTFWPDQVLKDSVACLAVLATVLILAIYKGAELSAPANPAESFKAARPEWYFLFLFQFLRFPWVNEFGEQTGMGEAFGAIYVPGFLMLILFLMPILAIWKWGHRFNQAFVWVMVVAIIGLTGYAFYNDANDQGHQDAIEQAHIDAERVMEIASDPHSLIPVEGAVTMLPNDPLVQGPRIFEKNCAGCHHYNGLNGQGVKVTEERKDEEGNPIKIETKPTAADLGNYGSREWIKSVLTHYPEHFAPLKNAPWYAEAKQKEEAGEEVAYVKVDEGEMADFSRDAGQTLLMGENNELAAVAEYFVREAVAADDDTRQFARPELNEDLAKRGEKIIEAGKNYEGILESGNCFDCHGQNTGAPDLTNYGSAKWLKGFISNPGAPEYYGEKNRMPAYAETLSERELDLLVRWMTGDYAPTRLALEKLGAQEPAHRKPAREPETKTESPTTPSEK